MHRGLRVHRSVGCFVVLIAVAWFSPQRALAWGRLCKWPTGSGITTIETRVHCESFEGYGYSCEAVKKALLLAHRAWNTQGHVNVRLGDPEETTEWDVNSGKVLYRMHPETGNPFILQAVENSTSGSTAPECTANVTSFMAPAHWSYSDQKDASAPSLASGAMFAAGYALGLGCVFCSCGASDAPTGPSLMDLRVFDPGLFMSSRTLWHDDFIGLRSGNSGCEYSPAVPSSDMRIYRGSTQQFSSFTGSTNATPAIAASPSGNHGVVAFLDENAQLVVYRWAPGQGGSNLSIVTNLCSTTCPPSMAGPQLVYGNGGKFLLAYPVLDAENEGRIRLGISSDNGASWEWEDAGARFTGHRVGLAWSELPEGEPVDGGQSPGGAWILAYAKQPSQASTPDWSSARDIVVRAFTWTQSGITWLGSQQWDNRRAAGGVDVTCARKAVDAQEPTGYEATLCWVVYPDGNVDGHVIRVGPVIAFQPEKSIFQRSFAWSFTSPAWEVGRYLQTPYDVSAAYLPGGDGVIALGFRERPVPVTSTSRRQGVLVRMDDYVSDLSPTAKLSSNCADDDLDVYTWFRPPGFKQLPPAAPEGDDSIMGPLAPLAVGPGIAASSSHLYFIGQPE
jgi:hypothetical protein